MKFLSLFEAITYTTHGNWLVNAMDDDKCVGILRWNEFGGIQHAWVHPEYRRQGIATEMLRRARLIFPDVHHGVMSQDGQNWARAVP